MTSLIMRRSMLSGLIAAPAIVRASSLMAIRPVLKDARTAELRRIVDKLRAEGASVIWTRNDLGHTFRITFQ